MGAFADRAEAGRRLAARLGHLRGQDVVVLGIPRGGVPVAWEVARALRAPLDVVVVRKLGLPVQPELAMGAIGEGGYRLLDRSLIRRAGVTDLELRAVEERERQVLHARVRQLRRGREPVDLTGRVAVVVDDGLATGATARVACEVARHLGASRVVLGVPVAPAESLREISEADEIVCVETPAPFLAVGNHYRDFTPTDDAEIVALLDHLDDSGPGDPTGDLSEAPGVDAEISFRVGRVRVKGRLQLPPAPAGVVVFAHGTGSSRHSPRNRYVASKLQEAGLGTLLMDLLTPGEERDRRNVFDVELLAARVLGACRWLAGRPDTAGLPIGVFGASTGAAAALWAAAEPGSPVAAVVSRGGRPDLAGPRLSRVTAPTLLIVGAADPEVLRLNQWAHERLRCPRRLSIVDGASHLFEEPGTLARAAGLATSWFGRYLAPVERAARAERERTDRR
jgi:putative phosphoribosyl transferase